MKTQNFKDIGRVRNGVLERGGRWTRSRQAVLNVYAEDSRPMTADEVWKKIGRGSVDRASVFRTVDLFRGLGILAAAEETAEGRRYELADGYRPHHHHLICGACGSVEDFEECSLNGLENRIRRKTRFLVSRHELRFLGVCGRCR